MDIIIKGNHLEVTSSLREYVETKIGGLEEYNQDIINADVILKTERALQIAKATLHIPHMTLHAEATEDDMYAAIDKLEEKLKHQLAEHKSKFETQRNHRPKDPAEAGF